MFPKNNKHFPNPYSNNDILSACLGAFIVIFILSILNPYVKNGLLFASFGATSIIVFGFYYTPFAQPRNVFFGHIASTGIGLLCYHFVSHEIYFVAVPVAICIAFMMYTRTVHPPAVGNVIAIYLYHLPFITFLFPVVFGIVLIIIVAILVNKYIRKKEYPLYW